MRILYLDIDSLRADHLGCYGYHRNTSPTIDAIAREGVVFEQAYTPDAPCLPSRTAFYSGRFGIQTGVVGHGGTAAQPKTQAHPWRAFRDLFSTTGLAGRLQQLGYHTAMISPFGNRHSAHWFYAGFNEIHDTGGGGAESAEEVQPVVDKWLADNLSRDSWYLHINYWDPHTPLRAPASCGDPFAKEPLPAWLENEDIIRQHNQCTGPHTSLEIGMYNDAERPQFPRQPGKVTDRASLRKVIDGYDTAIRHVDDQIARIVDSLREAGIYDETMIVISADHGENLGELGIYQEHGTADNITCRIPLVIKYPGGVQGARDSAFHYNLDLAPTLMELHGKPSPEIWDGQSFAETLRTGKKAGREDLVVSQCCHVCQRSVRWEDWLYIRTYHDGFHLFPNEMLFNLRDDPHETKDLASQSPDLCREGAWRLSRWHDDQMQKMVRYTSDTVDPLWTVLREGGPFHANLAPGPGSPENGVPGFLEYLHHLEATGRAEGAQALRERYAREIASFEP